MPTPSLYIEPIQLLSHKPSMPDHIMDNAAAADERYLRS